MRAWTEKDTFAFNGRFNQQRYVNIWPRPIQNEPHPPIWIPGGGSVETWRWCAEMDYVYCYLSYYGYKAGLATMEGFWDEMERLGKDRNPYRAGFLQFVGVAESRQQALELYTRAGRVLLRPLPARRSALRRAARLHDRGTQRAGIESHDEQGRATSPIRRPRRALKATDMKDIVDGGYVHHRLARRGGRAAPPCRAPASMSAI